LYCIVLIVPDAAFGSAGVGVGDFGAISSIDGVGAVIHCCVSYCNVCACVSYRYCTCRVGRLVYRFD
jgi:hypothetical protein